MHAPKIGFGIAFAVSLVGCDKVKSAAKGIEDALFEEPPYEAVPGESAAPHLHAAPGSAPTDAAALSQAMSVAAQESSEETLKLLGYELTDDDEKIQEVDGKTIDLFVAGADQKAAFKSDSFEKPTVDVFNPPRTQEKAFGLAEIPVVSSDYDPKKDVVALDSASWNGKNEIIISTLDRVSVKDQQQRGTCASFAGISALEYLVLKKYGSQVASVDLSEQRFYMMSKPDVWEAGGGKTDEDGGSAWITGYELSFGKEGTTSPTDNAPLNVPLEKDCAYNGAPGANEIQIPQANSCKRGAIRVSNVTETYESSSDGGVTWTMHSNAPRSAQEIFDYIKKNDLPVPVGTILTENWQENDGMITLAKSKQPGFGPHAGGHAYLIVGARKLDEAQFPGEGGMCFVIRNSWGTGWGLNGFSCMTLAWFNEYRRPIAYNVALDVEVDLEYLKANSANSLPAVPPESTGPVGAVTTPPAVTPEPAPVVTPIDPPAPPAGGAPVVGDNGTPAVQPAATTPDGFTIGKLATKDGGLAQVLWKRDGVRFLLRAVLSGQQATTQLLELNLEGDDLLFDDEQHKKDRVRVGRIDGDLVTLCSRAYAQTCHLNLIKEESKLVVGVTEAEFRNYEPDENADFKSLVSFRNYGIDYALGDGVFSDFRFVIGNQPTNPIRLAIKPVSGDIMFQGRVIGNYQKLSFCSGEFKSVCRVLMNQKDRTVKILFKAKKNS